MEWVRYRCTFVLFFDAVDKVTYTYCHCKRLGMKSKVFLHVLSGTTQQRRGSYRQQPQQRLKTYNSYGFARPYTVCEKNHIAVGEWGEWIDNYIRFVLSSQVATKHEPRRASVAPQLTS